MDSHLISHAGEPWERVRGEGVLCMWICYVIEGLVGYGINIIGTIDSMKKRSYFLPYTIIPGGM